jgi:hypothetical protein
MILAAADLLHPVNRLGNRRSHENRSNQKLIEISSRSVAADQADM